MSENGSIHTDPTKRHDFVFLFDVTQGNPNGDPDAENMPRVDPETMHGIVTDVCLKRKVRDYVAGVLGRENEIFIQSKVALNKLILDGFRKAGFEPAQVALTVDEQADEEWIARIESKIEEGFSLVENSVAFAGEKMTAQYIAQRLIEGDDPQEFKARLRALAKRLGDAASHRLF